MATLSISFTPASPSPANGYRIKYWNVNTPGSVTTVSPNVSSSPAVISGVADGCYAGTIEAACSGGQYSTPVNFNACSALSCITGTNSAVGNCSSGQTSTFTLASGYSVSIGMTGYYYSGTGTRTITGALLDNSNNVIQNFTYTQTGSSQGTTTPSSYTLSTAGTYKLQVDQVNCTNGSGTATMSLSNCQTVTPPPTGNSYCVQVTSETFTESSQECSGVTDSYTVYTFTLKDSNGNPVNAPSSVNITFNGWTSYYGGGSTFSANPVISTGNQSTTSTVYTSQALNGAPGCPCPCTTTISVDETTFAAFIAAPNSVTMCALPYNCVSGNCVQAINGTYATLSACQAACTSGGGSGGSGGGGGGSNCVCCQPIDGGICTEYYTSSCPAGTTPCVGCSCDGSGIGNQE